MNTLTRTVITIETTPAMLRRGTVFAHEALLDGDENLRTGDEVLIFDGGGTYRSARVTGHDDDTWELRLLR